MLTIILQWEYCGDPVFQFAGASGKEYPFQWDKALTQYVFTPECQEDADDIFRQSGQMWRLSALCAGEREPTAKTKTGVPKPSLPARYYRDLDADELAEMARSNGIAFATESAGKPRLMELLEAYFLGAGMQREQPKRATEMVQTLATPPSPAPVSITAADIPIVAQADEPPSPEISEATGKPKRKYVKNPKGPVLQPA